MIEPLCRLMGIGLEAFHEFGTKNIKEFNAFVEDSPNVEVSHLIVLVLLNRRIEAACFLQHEFERERELPPASGGTQLPVLQWWNFRSRWNSMVMNILCRGEHLINFEADHGEIIGIFGKKESQSMKLVKEIVESWEANNKSTWIILMLYEICRFYPWVSKTTSFAPGARVTILPIIHHGSSPSADTPSASNVLKPSSSKRKAAIDLD